MYKAVCMKQSIESDQAMREIADSLAGKPVLLNYDNEKPIGVVISASFTDGFIRATFDCTHDVCGMFAGPGYKTRQPYETLCLGVFPIHADKVYPIEKVMDPFDMAIDKSPLGVMSDHYHDGVYKISPTEKISTTEQLQQRIDRLESAIRDMNKRCNDHEGTDLLQFCMGLTHNQHSEHYDIIKSVIRPEEK